MKLNIDLDSVTADLLKKWLELYNNDFNDNKTFDDVTDWDFSNKKCSNDQWYNYLTLEGLFFSLEPIKDSIEITERLLSDGHQLLFVTAAPYSSKTAAYEKYWWVEKYFPHIGKNKVFIAHEKQEVKGDLLFDDAPKNLINYPGIKVVFDYPYNRDYNADYRVSNWQEFYDLIKEIS